MESDIRALFNLTRLYDYNHILIDAPIKYKYAYYNLLRYYTQSCSNRDDYELYFSELYKLLGLNDNLESTGNKEYLKILKKPDRKRQNGFLRFFKKPIYVHRYIYPLMVEIAYIVSRENVAEAEQLLNNIMQEFKLKRYIVNCMNEYFDMLVSNEFYHLLDYVKQTFSTSIESSLLPITQHIIKILEYEKLPVLNVAIIGTMSAGKSTFINALIGNEVFPESNSACTAKITSVYDNDFYNRITGIALHKENVEMISNRLSNKDLTEWNTNKCFDRIILEGNLDNISSKDKVVAIHDTPGTNFSGDDKHKKRTVNFLKNTQIDIVLCVINAQYIATTDGKKVLSDIEKIIRNKNIEIIFILNKIDSFDSQKESIEQAIFDVQNFLKTMKFEKHILIPISTKAARLFKMVISNRYNKFTEDEMDEFKRLFRKFSKGFIATPIGIDLPKLCSSNNNESLIIDGKEYSINSIKTALYNTGFPVLENIINKLGDYNG